MIAAALSTVILIWGVGTPQPEVSGEPRAWHPLAISFAGPAAAETDSSPNPFLDIRLQVEFVGPSNQRFDVPGFFDGDGHAGPAGNVWRARFAPDAAGTWRYSARFRKGPAVAIQLEPDAGESLEFPNLTGTLEIAPRDPDAPGFLKWGFLGYAGGHYLRFAAGPYWLRGGTDEPENLLAFAGFDNTLPKHRYAAHKEDWREGDPDWNNGRGRAIIGMVNYLGREQVNSMYFLLMNVGGDGKDVWPWTSKIDGRGSPSNDNLHFDTNKLRQWDTVFAHAQRQGVCLHAVFNEAEEANKRELDNGELGPERKLYYREMIARFGHHLALEWNLCEEYNLNLDFGAERLGEFAAYIRAVDPYDHPIAVHSAGDPVEELRFVYGDPRYDMLSVQLNQRPIHEVTEALWRETRKAGRPIPISLDEFTLDRGQQASHIPVDDADGHRREKLWPTYFSGGQIEFILEGLLKVDSFKTPEREKLWHFMAIARHFMEEHLPFWEMEPDDALASGGGTISLAVGKGHTVPMGPQVFVKRGEVYAVYLPTASPAGSLDLSTLDGQAELRWFSPRSGAFVGSSRRVDGGARMELGSPPEDTQEDWVVLVKRIPPAAELPRTNVGREVHFPAEHWDSRTPDEVGLKAPPLDLLAERLGGDGCIVRDGYLVKAWGDVSRRKDWASAAKPVLSTLLLAAVADGRLANVDARVKDAGWPLSEKDAAMTYRHLANMVSGYCCAEPPGAAWGYNDFAIQLYARSLEKLFGTPLDVAFRERFSRLHFEDGEFFGARNGLGVSASVRDFARLGWLWLNEGNWSGDAVLPKSLVRECFRPGVPSDLPRTKSPTDDYLAVGSYGGGTDQTPFGPGVYGFNLWFNVPADNGRRAWPQLPPDAYQANGMWNRDTVTVIPSWRMVVAVRGAERGSFQPGDADNAFNETFGLLAQAIGADREPSTTGLPSVLGFGSGAHHWRRIRDDKRVIQPTENQAAYEPSQVREIVANILRFQRANGGWPKDYDMLAVLDDEQRAALVATRDRDETSFDNSNIHSQVDYLARANAIVDSSEAREACLRGFDFVLAAQLPGGGFPQSYPKPTGYHAHITFNDGVMIGNLNLLKDAADNAPHWHWLDEERRARARAAVERGIACILECQIRAGAKRKGWCQQHDERTLEPTSARTFELASVCPQDTTEILRFLMRVEPPTPELVAAVQGAAEWLEQTSLHDIRVNRVPAADEEFLRHRANFDTVVVREIGAGPLWARHYEIETDRPIFAGRDAVKRYALADIDRERRTGTPWYGNWPATLLATEYPKWQRTWNP